MEDIKDIIKEADYKRHIAKTRSLDISFNELADMYTEEELIISPEYQRLFRWNKEEQSRFIESLILELPVPPIFVIEKEDGIYELIDGLQRVSSYLNFRGDLNTINEEAFDEDSPEMVGNKNLTLVGCDIVEKLNGYTFDTLPKTIQIKLKRNFIRLEVISKESDNELKYHMFKRLNKGGEKLTAQEIRNCTIRILSSELMDFIVELAKYPSFKNTIKKISLEEIKKKFDHELVLRYFAQKNDLENYGDSLPEFLTEFMEKVAKGVIEFDYKKEKKQFEKTFDFLDKVLGEDIFSTQTVNGVNENFVRYYYDSFSIGIEKIVVENYFDLSKNDILDILREKFKDLKNKGTKVGEKLYSKRTGSKTNLKFKREIVEKHLRGIDGE